MKMRQTIGFGDFAVSRRKVKEDFFNQIPFAAARIENRQSQSFRVVGKNEGIGKIEYDLLNLPQQVDILSPLAEARNA
jgi:hypothetical protein